MRFVIPNYIFIILITFVTAWLTFLTVKGGLTDNRFSNFWKRITKRGIVVILLFICMVSILVFQEINIRNSDHNKDVILEREKNSRDSLIASGIDSSNSRLFDNLSIAFAKQNLKIDTFQNRIVTINDSLKNLIVNSSSEAPVLAMNDQGIILRSENDTTYELIITITSRDAGSTNYKIDTYLLWEFTDGDYLLSKDERLFPPKLKISKDATWNVTLTYVNTGNVKNIFIYFRGNYTNLDGNRKYDIDQVYNYIYDTKRTGTLLNPERDKIINIILSIPPKKYETFFKS